MQFGIFRNHKQTFHICTDTVENDNLNFLDVYTSIRYYMFNKGDILKMILTCLLILLIIFI